MNVNRKLLAISIAVFAVFVVFTVMAKVCDASAIAPDGSYVGFSHINASANRVLGASVLCYKLTEYLGYLCLVIAAIHAVAALRSLVKAKSLLKMDRLYLATMVLYAVVIGFYILFELFVVNVRPTEAEASYPSSHTMLALCVLYSTAVILKRKGDKPIFKVLTVLCYVAMALMVVMRLLSGVHWLTDIIGAIILSASLLLCYRAFTPEENTN